MHVFIALVLALLPSPIKVLIYRRLFGYSIGKRVRIGVSGFLRVKHCTIGDGVTIGHLNLFVDVAHLLIGDSTSIGYRNIVRGGERVTIGAYTTVLRNNVMNSIPNAESANPHRAELEIGPGCAIANGHWFDFTDRIELGHNTIVGGRNSSFWTHNRQKTRPIRIGHHCYLGSEVRFAPGATVSAMSVVAIGSVVTSAFQAPMALIGGNPAAQVRPLGDVEYVLVSRKNRADVPDEIAYADLPPKVQSAARAFEQTVNMYEAIQVDA